MTANRRLKKRVRARVARTGESYTTALRHLRGNALENDPMQFKRIDKSDVGFTMEIPARWRELAPGRKPRRRLEIHVARFAVDPGDFGKNLYVAWLPNLDGESLDEVADDEVSGLVNTGCTELVSAPTRVDGMPARVVECRTRSPAAPWYIRQYFIQVDSRIIFLSFGSPDLAREGPAIDRMVAGFRAGPGLPSPFRIQLRDRDQFESACREPGRLAVSWQDPKVWWLGAKADVSFEFLRNATVGDAPSRDVGDVPVGDVPVRDVPVRDVPVRNVKAEARVLAVLTEEEDATGTGRLDFELVDTEALAAIRSLLS